MSVVNPFNDDTHFQGVNVSQMIIFDKVGFVLPFLIIYLSAWVNDSPISLILLSYWLFFFLGERVVS